MRILAVEPGPHFSVADVHRGWVKALKRLGCQVVNFNFEDRLDFYSQVMFKRDGRYQRALSGDDAVRMAAKGIEVAAYEWWPDVILITSCFFVPPMILEILRKRPHKIVMLLTESPYEDQGQIDRVRLADVALINDPINIDQYRAVNPNTHYMPHAYDPDVHHLRRPQPEMLSDFCFVGTGFPSRVDFFSKVDWSGIDLTLAGNWKAARKTKLRKYVAHPIDECLNNSDAVDLYASTKVSANLYRRESETEALQEGWAMGPREVELAACGTFFLTEKRGENREVLPMVPTFDGPEDFETQLRYYLTHPDSRAEIAAKARSAIADRTFEQNASRLLSLL